jgi:hypothetical protein
LRNCPVDADYPAYFSSLPADTPVGYWHDTGHADIKEGMGLLKHREHLQSLAPWTIGFHLHDVNAHGNDHQPIGAGHIDFQMVSEFWRAEHLLTLEFSPRLSPEEALMWRPRRRASKRCWPAAAAKPEGRPGFPAPSAGAGPRGKWR